MKIKDYAHACLVLNLSAEESKLPFEGEELTARQKNTNADYSLKIIIEAAHTDVDDDGYYDEPRFYNSGSGWSYSHFGSWTSHTSAGPRLRFADYDLMREVVSDHDALYQDLLN